MRKLSVVHDALLGLCVLLGVLGLIVLAWWAHPSERYLQPITWTYDDHGRVTFVRVAREEVTANWVHEIILNDGTECSASGTAFYQFIEDDPNTQINEANTARFSAPTSLRRCLDSGQSYKQRLSWTVLLFDVVPLRPVEIGN